MAKQKHQRNMAMLLQASFLDGHNHGRFDHVMEKYYEKSRMLDKMKDSMSM